MVGPQFKFLTMKPLEDAARNAALFDAFDPDFTPTHASVDEHAKTEFRRDELVPAIVELRQKPGGAFQGCGIARRKPPKYAGYFWSQKMKVPGYLTLTFDDVTASQVPAVLGLADRLAAVLELDYGTAHLTFPDATPLYNYGGDAGPQELQKYGPLPLGARTWMGPHVVGLIGRDQLEAAGLSIASTPWGALRVDLLPDLANQPMAALQAKQTEVMARLADTGVFAIFKPGALSKKGPNWKPMT